MGRTHGSQPDMCWLINCNKDFLEEEIRKCRSEWDEAEVEFLWPLSGDNYAEFSITDNKIWNKMGMQCPEEIRTYKFWPSSGAKWDAAAILNNGNEKILLLFEAKAHKGELMSRKKLSDISGKNQNTIKKSIESIWRPITNQTKGIDDWLRSYQFANRVAHTKKLLENNIPVQLIYVLFCDEKSQFPDVTGKDGWEEKLKKEYDIMGLSVDAAEIKEFYHVFFPKGPSKDQLLAAGIAIDEDKY